MTPYVVDAPAIRACSPSAPRSRGRRTALALAVNALLSMRSGLVADEPGLVAVGVLLFAASGAAVAIGTVRRRQLSGARAGDHPPAGALVGVAATTLLASAGGVASDLRRGRGMSERHPELDPTLRDDDDGRPMPGHRRRRVLRVVVLIALGALLLPARALDVRRREVDGRSGVLRLRRGVRHGCGGIPVVVRPVRAGRARLAVLRDLRARRASACSQPRPDAHPAAAAQRRATSATPELRAAGSAVGARRARLVGVASASRNTRL